MYIYIKFKIWGKIGGPNSRGFRIPPKGSMDNNCCQPHFAICHDDPTQ